MQNNPPTKEQLLAESERLNLAIDVAFQTKVLQLLSNPEANHKEVMEMMKMHEARLAQKLKQKQAELKAKELAHKEEYAERKLALAERKQATVERKQAQPAPDFCEKNLGKAAGVPASVTVNNAEKKGAEVRR